MQAGHRIVQDINRHRRIIKTARVVVLQRSEEGVSRTIDAKALTINTITATILAVGFVTMKPPSLSAATVYWWLEVGVDLNSSPKLLPCAS